MSPAADSRIAEVERWFVGHGLPYFVEGAAPRAPWLRRTAVRVALALVVLGPAVAVGLWQRNAADGLLVAMVLAGVVVAVVAVRSFDVAPMARWALDRTRHALGALFPLAMRALPLLLLFTTFFFINTEVWQVAASLDRAVLAVTVLLFCGIAVLFLLVRLPEELDRVSHDLSRARVAEACVGTPLEGCADAVGEGVDHVPLARRQRANLVLVLLFVQSLQVLLLSVCVFGFFLVFGVVAIRPEIVESWVGAPPSLLPGALGQVLPVSAELFSVAVFLAAFSGLYFTVYAVIDETYRSQFFTDVADELEKAVGVRAAYLALRAAGVDHVQQA